MLKPWRIAVFILAPILASVGCSTIDKIATVPYTIDHELFAPGELSAVSLEHGDKLVVTIINTDRGCYLYNLREVLPPSPFEISTGQDDSVAMLEITHDEANVAYIVNVTTKPGRSDCTDPGPREWRIPVRPRWNLAASGGFAGHDLTAPVYFLEPTQRDKDDPATEDVIEKESGFLVRQNKDAEDGHSIAGAAFITLYQSARGFKGINWAPLSFGLAVDEARNDYLLGTSFRFGNRAYLTVGRIFGSVPRLRDGAVVNETFTTDANFLASPPTRRDDAWFFGIHYSFLDQGVSNLFKTKVGFPVAQPGAQGQGNGSGGGRVAAQPFTLTFDKTSEKPGETIKIKPPQGKSFGGPDPDVSIDFGGVPTDSTANTLTWTSEEITMKVPAIPAGDDVVVTILQKGDDGVAKIIATGSFKVLAP